jgi:peptide-methionine (R)-S-oxide reductase
MFRSRLRVWASLSMVSMIVSLASLAATAQDPFQEAAKSAGDSTDKKGPDATSARDAPSASKAKPKTELEFVTKTDAEWRKLLTRSQYAVTREKMTEPAFSGRYATGHFRGTFLCVCCKAELFSADHKFDSGTGWPSFFRPVNERALRSAIDYSAGEPRMEVMCRRCGAHLGHVFDDGPAPTGLRFCINSISLTLRRPDASLDGASSGKGSSQSSTRSKTKTKTKSKMSAQPRPAVKTAPSGNDSDDLAAARESDAASGKDATKPAGSPQ